MTVNNFPENNAKIIRQFLLNKGLNECAIAGLLGNLYAESRLRPNNLQNSYETKLGLTDDTYTAAVDSGAYGIFTSDKAGYGLAQWTSPGRKTGLYNHIKAANRSIGDIYGQLEYLWLELNGAYKKTVLDVLVKCTSIREAAEVVVCKFEVPKSVINGGAEKENTILTRTGYAQDFFDLYANKTETEKPNINVCMLTKNDCYKTGAIIKPSKIVVHSTGANNPTLRRYVQPDDGILGKNSNNNDWNRPGVNKCVNAFIGKDITGAVKIYQTLPWNMRPWGCGPGKLGSYNNSAIQFEICEDTLSDVKYFNEAFDKAAYLCAYLCERYNIAVVDVVSHHEAYLRGYASGHADCDHWLKRFNKDMNWFREQVKAKLSDPEPVPVDTSFKVKIDTDALNIREGAGTNFKIVGCIRDRGVYTIVETSGSWGRLKSGAGWISLLYVKRL